MNHIIPRVMAIVLAIGALGITTVVVYQFVLPRPLLHHQPPAAARAQIQPTDPAFRPGPIEPQNQPNPPALITLPDFTLTDQSGGPFGLKELRGKVWVADFIFTRCRGPCPMMTSNMAEMHRQLATDGWGDVRLVSVSVDPEYDTPEVLRQYADRFQADPHYWRFLTGDRKVVWSLIEQGFKLPVGQAEHNIRMPIFHSQRFVLVDRDGRIRGYYDGLTPQGRAQLIRDLKRVQAEPHHATTAVPLQRSPAVQAQP